MKEIEKVFKCYTPLTANDLNLLKDHINEIIRYLNSGGGGGTIPSGETDCNNINLYSVSPRNISVESSVTECYFNISSSSAECDPLGYLTFKKKNNNDPFRIDGIVNNRLKVTIDQENIENQDKVYEFYCYTNNEEQNISITITQKKSPNVICNEFSLDKNNIQFTNAGGQESIYVTLNNGCESNLSIINYPSWMSTPTINGKTIIITVPNYTETNSRNGNVVVSLSGAENPQTISIIQTGRQVICDSNSYTLSQNSINLNSTASTNNSIIYTKKNSECPELEASTQNNWITIIPSSSNGEIKFNVSEYTSTVEPRSGSIILYKSGTQEQIASIEINQAAKQQTCTEYSISSTSFNLSSEATTGNQVTYNKPSNDCPSLIASTTDSWITITNSSTSPITFNVSENTSTTDSRTGYITLIKSGTETTIQTITIIQAKKEVYTVSYYYSNNESTYYFTLLRNGVIVNSEEVIWNIIDNTKIIGSSQLNYYKIILNNTPNYYDICTFTVEATYNGQTYQSKEITIPDCKGGFILSDRENGILSESKL